jgi:hypothetical protein
VNKVFVEYKVNEERMDDYLQFMSNELDRSGMELYEGTEQPGLFVELWPDMDSAAFRSFKLERTEPVDSPWRTLDGWIAGGLAKVHVWHFTGRLR